MPQLGSRLTTRLLHLVGIALGLLLAAGAAASAQTTSPPEGWLDANIGGGTGAVSYGNDGSIVVTGSGTDIWGTADSFHYTYQVLNGDGDFRARVIALNGPQDWTKAGLMIRQSLDPGSPHHFLLGSTAKGLAYQRRTSPGASSLSTSLTGVTPVWMRIRRAGTLVELSTSHDGINWDRAATVTWPTGPTYVGFAVTSHDASTTPTAFGQFTDVAVTGNGRSAPFVEVSEPEAGDSLSGAQPSIIRWQANTTDADAIAYFNVYHGVEQNGTVAWEAIDECTRLADNVRACTWSSPAPPSDAAHVLVMAVDAHNDQGTDASERFSILEPPAGHLPAGWSGQDIGRVSTSGSTGFDGRTFTVSGSGADIWGTADEFHFAHVTMTGDFTITARVTSVQKVNAWTKAGLMVREGLSPGARHASFFATPSITKGTAFQFRDPENDISSHIAGPDLAPPVWLKLVRRGDTVTGYYRHNITDPWTTLQYKVFSFHLADSLDVGLAVSSHVDGQLATAQFTDVVAEPLPPWQVGSVASIGTGSSDQTIFGLFGQGSDVWGTADSFMYGFVRWVGDGTMTARVRSLRDSSSWAKAGVMFRESLAPGSKHVFAMLTPGHGANLQYRPSTSGQSASGGHISGAAPGWIRVTRHGDTFLAQFSTGGRTWTDIGEVTVPMGQSVYVGIAHTSHNAADAGAAIFDDLRITR